MSDQVADIKSKVDIARLIGERVQLKQRGRRFLALCPFHSEKTPSFTVSPEIGIFKCFGCGAAGDAFTFLERYEGMTFIEALEYLAQKAGVTLEHRVVDSQMASIDRQIFEVNHLASEYFHFLLTTHNVGENARQYLAKRGVKQAAIDQYFLGYAPARWDSLLTFLTKKGYKPELLIQAGLVIARKKVFDPEELRPEWAKGKMEKESDVPEFSSLHPSSFIPHPSECYDRFRGRVIFPLRDPRGQVIGFSGRVLPETRNKEQGTRNKFIEAAKYINSPETPVYTKGKHLYGIFENKEEIRKEDRAILVEGELDVISSWQAHVGHVVAVKGTAVTHDQIKLIRRYTRHVTIALDADPAGWDALVRSLPIFELYGMNVRVVALPSGSKDPDELATSDPVGWRMLIKQASNVYDALISGTLDRIGSTSGEQKKRASEVLIPILSGIANVIEQDHWIGEVARRMGVRGEAVRKQMEAFQRTGALESSKFNVQSSKLVDKKTRSEVLSRYVLALLIQSGKPAPQELKEEWLVPVGIQKIISRLKSQISKSKGTLDPKRFRASLPAELLQLFDDAALVFIEENIDLELERTIRCLEQTWIKEELARSRTDPVRAAFLTKRLRELQLV